MNILEKIVKNTNEVKMQHKKLEKVQGNPKKEERKEQKLIK